MTLIRYDTNGEILDTVKLQMERKQKKGTLNAEGAMQAPRDTSDMLAVIMITIGL
jgi:hypothetical protein